MAEVTPESKLEKAFEAMHEATNLYIETLREVSATEDNQGHCALVIVSRPYSTSIESGGDIISKSECLQMVAGTRNNLVDAISSILSENNDKSRSLFMVVDDAVKEAAMNHLKHIIDGTEE